MSSRVFPLVCRALVPVFFVRLACARLFSNKVSLSLLLLLYYVYTVFTHRVLTRPPRPQEVAGGRDGTIYGAFSTDAYYQHHAGAISMAIVKSAAEASWLEKGISALHVERSDVLRCCMMA